MAGTWKTNVFFALFGFLLTLFFSLLQNSISTSFVRGLIGFVAFFFVAYMFRWMVGFIQREASEKGGGNDALTYERDNAVEPLLQQLTEEEQQKVIEYVRRTLREGEK